VTDLLDVLGRDRWVVEFLPADEVRAICFDRGLALVGLAP
jgi:hypothetical protein